MHDDALRAIESAAFAIARERMKLDEAIRNLRGTVEALDPAYTLSRSGNLVAQGTTEEVVEAGRKPPGPGAIAAVEYQQTVRQPEPAPSLVERAEQTVRPPEPVFEVKLRVEQFLREQGPKRYSTLEKHFSGVNSPVLYAAVQELQREGTIHRGSNTGGAYQHRDWTPKVQEGAVERPHRGSGTRQDIAPGSTPTPPGTTSSSDTASPTTPSPKATPSGQPSTSTRTPLPSSPSRGQQVVDEDGTRTWNGEKWVFASHPYLRPDFISRERGLYKLYLWLSEDLDRTATAREVSETILPSVQQSMVNRYFALGVERGFFELRDRRRSAGQTGGRFSDAFGAVEDAEFTTPSPMETVKEGLPDPSPTTARSPVPKAEAAPATQEPVRTVLPTLEQVRDIVVGHKEAVSINDLCLALDVPNTRIIRSSLRAHLAVLTQRGIVQGDGERSDTHTTWTYVPPTDEGAASRADRARRPLAPERAVRAAVAGTGRGLRASNAEVQRIINACSKAWGPDSVSKTGTNHFQVITPSGEKIRFAGTPSQRSLMADKRKLRKAGLALA